MKSVTERYWTPPAGWPLTSGETNYQQSDMSREIGLDAVGLDAHGPTVRTSCAQGVHAQAARSDLHAG
ncbi:MAG: hypothetical protein ACRDJ9_29660 [Dehalococcoidia bacterium]